MFAMKFDKIPEKFPQFKITAQQLLINCKACLSNVLAFGIIG